MSRLISVTDYSTQAASPLPTCSTPSPRRDVVNLIALRGTEKRYGNGDRRFTTAEQARAFRDAVYFSNDLANMVGTGRRLRLGVDFAL